MGKVILITSLPEEIWIAQMNIQTLKAPAHHTWLFPLGQTLPGYVVSLLLVFTERSKMAFKRRHSQHGMESRGTPAGLLAWKLP